MIKHISTVHIGESPHGTYNIEVSIDNKLYRILSVSEKDYQIYKKQKQYGEGYKAFNYLRNRYEVMRVNEELSKENKELFQQEIEKFFKTIKKKVKIDT